jgi:hypothetical protein
VIVYLETFASLLQADLKRRTGDTINSAFASRQPEDVFSVANEFSSEAIAV